MSNFQEQRQLNNDNFFKNLFTKANEHSKKLTIIDTIIYFILMVGSLTVMIIWPILAQHCVNTIGHVTTAFVALRATYGIKAAIENYAKIKKDFQDVTNLESSITLEEETSASTSEESLG